MKMGEPIRQLGTTNFHFSWRSRQRASQFLGWLHRYSKGGWAIKKLVFIKVMPIFGSVIIFVSWGVQQTLLDEANSTLQEISNAWSVFQTYQSNNALFNALKNPNNRESIEILQIYNYEFGLRGLEDLLDDEDRATIPPPVNPFDSTADDATRRRITSIVQERTVKIQEKVFQKQEEANQHKEMLNNIFLLMYAIGSLIVLTGGLLGAIQSARDSESQSSANRINDQDWIC
jgi:hypothetical protein